MPTQDLMIFVIVCFAISALLMIRSFRHSARNPLMSLAMIPLFIGLIVLNVDLASRDEYYADKMIYILIFMVLCIGVFIYRIGSEFVNEKPRRGVMPHDEG